MRKSISLAAFAVATACMLLVPGCTQQKKSISLRFKFEPGTNQVHRWTSKRHWQMIQNDTIAKEGTYEVSATIERDIRRVLADSTAEIIQKTTWTSLEPNKEDSTIMDTITGGRTLTVYTKPDGRLVDLEFPPDFEHVKDTAYLRSFYEQAATIFPNKTVQQGETWTHRTMVMLNGEQVEASTNYVLQSFAREKGYDCAVLEFTGDLVIPIKPSAEDSTQRQGVDRIEVEGLMYFAYTEGLIVSSRERWIQERERKYMKEGTWVEMNEIIEADGDYHIVSRD